RTPLVTGVQTCALPIFAICERFSDTTLSPAGPADPAAAAIALVTTTCFARADWIALPGAATSIAGRSRLRVTKNSSKKSSEHTRSGPGDENPERSPRACG